MAGRFRCVPVGRFAPSPTGRLHLGNLRTALIAWLFARSDRSRFLLRSEDLDQVATRPEHEMAQQSDLAAIGLDWDGPVLRQSERTDHYLTVLAELRAQDLLYPCYCTRREIQEAVRADHGTWPEGAYPGTCSGLDTAHRRIREERGRLPAWRLRAGGVEVSFTDQVLGTVIGRVDDFVVQRNDGVVAYNLAVVVDDHLQGVQQVVRGDDLALSTPRQLHLSSLLGWDPPSHAHVPLVLGPDGERLEKRHGAVTLADCLDKGMSSGDVLDLLVASLSTDAPLANGSLDAVVAWFRPHHLDRDPWVVDPASF